MTLQEQLRQAGVVGAGGAGFPAHVKAGAKADTVIANGAECEPLIHKDLAVMTRHAPEIVRGVRLLMQATGALARDYRRQGEECRRDRGAPGCDRRQGHHPPSPRDFYPSGDEYILVYEATGRLIPPQGIPLDVGVVVNNVETLYKSHGLPTGIRSRESRDRGGGGQHPSTFCVLSARPSVT